VVAPRAHTQTVRAPELLPREREIAIALSAAPAHIARGAAVYVLGPRGYEKARDGSNGFSCIVEREFPAGISPICYDAEGTATILPRSLRTGELQMQRKSMQEIEREMAEGFASGTYHAARRAGVAYMLSPDTREYNPKTGALDPVAPHVMIYAPFLRNADIGAGAEGEDQTAVLPFVANEGRPNAYIILMQPTH
jgi:hypothetical protein